MKTLLFLMDYNIARGHRETIYLETLLVWLIWFCAITEVSGQCCATVPYTGAAGNKVDTWSCRGCDTVLYTGPAVAVTLSSEVSLLGSFPFTTLTASQFVS